MGKATADPILQWIPQVSKQTKNPQVLRSKYYLVGNHILDHRSSGSWEIPDRKKVKYLGQVILCSQI